MTIDAVNDPTTGKPFEMENGPDAGFALKSPFDDHGKPTMLDFPAAAKAAK